jgi:hypothetical protein
VFSSLDNETFRKPLGIVDIRKEKKQTLETKKGVRVEKKRAFMDKV